jgi:hypothetical protein
MKDGVALMGPIYEVEHFLAFRKELKFVEQYNDHMWKTLKTITK